MKVGELINLLAKFPAGSEVWLDIDGCCATVADVDKFGKLVFIKSGT